MPLPSEGFRCDWTHEGALIRAVLEAYQARATAISGAREDVTRLHYPDFHDRPHLAEWRQAVVVPLASSHLSLGTAPFRSFGRGPVGSGSRQPAPGGASAAAVVRFLSSSENEVPVVRLVAPPLRLNPRAGS